MAEYKLSYTASDIDARLGEIDNVIKHTQQDLTEEQQAQARDNIGAVSLEEVEELLGIEEEFSVTGEVVELNVDVEPDTELEVISKIHRDETWGLSNKLVLHQVSGVNFVDLSSYLGGAGKVFEKNGLTATVNADGTLTVTGTNTNTGWTKVPDISVWYSETSLRVYPAGTYTIPTGLAIKIVKAECTDSYGSAGGIAGLSGNLTGKIVVPEPFRVIGFYHSVAGGKTEDVTISLGIFRSDSVPETGYEYTGNVYTATFDDNIYDGEYNWTTGELKDTDGNTVAYYKPQSIKRLSGVNYFWTGFGENTVSNVSSKNLEKVIIGLGDSAPEEAVPSICDFTLIPKTKDFGMNLYGDGSKLFSPGGLFNGMEVPLVTTRGKIVCVNSESNVEYTADVPELINSKGITDVMNGDKITKRWSERFYITRDPDIVETVDDGSGSTNTNPNMIATWIFSESDFDILGLPVESAEIPIVSPYFTNVTTSKLESQKLSYSEPYLAVFGFDADLKSYVFKCRARAFYSKALYQFTNAYFCYHLKEDVVRTDAMLSLYLEKGYAINFEQDNGAFDVIWEYAQTKDWPPIFTESGSYIWNSRTKPTTEEEFEQIINTTPGIRIEIPRSIEDAIRDSLHIAKRLNTPKDIQEDSDEVNNYGWIGVGDGTTDYTEKIQSKLTEIHNTTNGGTIYLGRGTYPISSSLIVYDNTRIIGDGQTVIEQITDNTHAIILNGSNITIKDLTVKLSGACTALTACMCVNSYNHPNVPDSYDSAFPQNMYAHNITVENVQMVGTYGFGRENGYPVVSDAYENYKGVGIYSYKLYFNYAHVDDVYFKGLHAGVHGGGGANYFNIVAESCKYGLYITGAGNNTYFASGHAFYSNDENGDYITMSDAIAYVEDDTNSAYHLRCYDSQAYNKLIFLGARAMGNQIDVQTVLSNGNSHWAQHEWNIMKYYIVDYGRGNVYNDMFKKTPFLIGSYSRNIGMGAQLELSNPVIQNVLSGAGVWGNISSNVEFANNGIALKDVCRYPSEKTANSVWVPYILSTVHPTEDNPVEIVIDYSNRPVVGIPNYFIQFDPNYIASDYTVHFDITNTGVFDEEFVIPVTDNTNITNFFDYPQISKVFTSYRMKFRFTKPLQIENLRHTMTNEPFDYNPDGLIGICNIGMTVNDYAGRSFLGQCGGSLYGNVDMHQNTLKNLPTPVDGGDAVSKSYLEERIAETSEFVLTDRTTGKKYNIYVDNGKLVMDEEVE